MTFTFKNVEWKDPNFHTKEERESVESSHKDHTALNDPYMVVDIIRLQQGIEKALLLKSKKKTKDNVINPIKTDNK